MPPESLFERVAKQTLQSVVDDEELLFEILRKILENYDGNPKGSMSYEHIYSPMFIQSFFNSPHFSINLLLKSEGTVLTDIQLKQKPITFFTKTQKDIIEKFFKNIQNNKPLIVHDWISMHHYIYFVYRNFVTIEPRQEKDDIPDKIYKKMRNLSERLLVHDASQLYVRLFATLRDFVMAAKRCFEKITDTKTDALWYLTSFLTYYNALCGAAQRLTTTVIEFDELLNCYNFNWLRFNKILFYTYFFKSVQSKLDKIQQLLKTRDIHNEQICDSYCLFLEDMNQTNSAWITHKLRTDALSKDLNNEKLVNDMKIFNSEKQFLNVNYWIPRSQDFMNCEINCSSFISYLLGWLGNVKNLTPTLVDCRGQCQCEKCILEEFLLQMPESQTFERFIKCDSCQNICLLESFALHIMDCHIENHTKTDICSTYLEEEKPVSKFLQQTMENLTSSTIFFRKTQDSEYNNPEPLLKIASEPPVFQDSIFCLTSESNCFKEFVKTKNSEPVLSIDDLLKKKCDVIDNKKTDDKFLNKENFAEIREKARMFCKKSDHMGTHITSKITINNSNSPKKSIQKAVNDVDTKVFAAMKHSTNHKNICNINNSEKRNNTCSQHQCKNDEENLTEIKKSCQDTCDHHKESRKCDCTYCEVFGTSVSASHFHKTNETRDRLRTRLNQRKEKFNETLKSVVNKTNSSPYPSVSKSSSSSSATVKSPTTDLGQQNNITSHTERVPNLSNYITQSDKNVVTKSSNGVNNKIEPAIFKRSISSLSTCSLNSLCKDNSDSRDINELLKFIEGDKNLDKLALAEKKAAKKARQKMKKEEERKKIEEEEKRKEQERIREKKCREQEQLRAEHLAKQLAEKIRKNKKNCVDIKMPYQKQGDLKCKKNKNSKNNTDGKHSIEETIPAMVTIKRIVENNNSPPTVTITLKGSTPDQDKLLYTLVNGHTKELNENSKINIKKNKNLLEVKNPNKYENSENNDSKKSKKKKKKAVNGEINNSGQTNEVKVTLSVDQICTKVGNSKKESKSENKNNNNNNRNTQKINDKIKTNKDLPVNIPMLRLPPGITITKVDGPINKNCRLLVNDTVNQNTNVPVSKSGVIVVDTEKLIQHTTSTTVEQPKTNNKKSKKKKNRKNENTQDTGGNNNNNNKKNNSTSSMVTLKNPIFQTLQTTLASKAINEKLITEVPNVMSCNQHASIIKNDNGMVTIRSPRLQHSLTNGAVMTNLLSELKPVIGPDVSSQYLQTCHSNFNDNNRVSSFNAQEILSGLPGIEITKVEKRSKDDSEIKKSCQTADVSIIPTSNGTDKFNFDKDDWPYESVFAPKDILEDDLDAEERELEAFKRFCQQSVPPKRKEKVAHLNVKDIVLKKKNDFVVN